MHLFRDRHGPAPEREPAEAFRHRAPVLRPLAEPDQPPRRERAGGHQAEQRVPVHQTAAGQMRRIAIAEPELVGRHQHIVLNPQPNAPSAHINTGID